MIRLAEKKDIDNINSLGKEVVDNFSKTYNVLEYLENKNYIILINEDNTINSFVLIYKNIDYYELEIIVVDKNYRNQKIGSKLLSYFENNFLSIDDTIYLEVAENNNIAKKLYLNNNFEIIGRRKKYYKDIDALIMKKVIK